MGLHEEGISMSTMQKKGHFTKAKGLNTFVAYCSLHAHKHIFFNN